eukprot:17419_1
MTLSTHKSILKDESQIIRRNYVKLNYQWLPRCAQLCNKYNIKLLKVDINKKFGTRTSGYDENDTYLDHYYHIKKYVSNNKAAIVYFEQKSSLFVILV